MNLQGQAVMVNGVNYSWGHVTAIIFGVPIIGITEVKFKKTQAKENNYGRGFDVVSRGYGNKEYEGSIKLYRDELQRIINASPNKDVTDIPPFTITVVFGNNISGVQAQTVVLKFAEFTQDIMEVSQGDTKILCEMPIVFAGIDYK